MSRPASPATPGDSADEDEVRYQIGEVADRTGVTQRTLRFYEERGLLQPAERMDGGFRLYSELDIEHIELIKRLQGLLNLSLAEIKEMVDAEALYNQIRATFRPDRDLLERKARIARIREAMTLQSEIVQRKMEQLVEMRGVIEERVEAIDRREAEIDKAMKVKR
ncbi:MAG: MerR family transcriptional regulator [Dehalococcoidia bacterium]|jgi:DNA-binding transcriptional MerR regulator|nr:MerR family transcriptional regulator [Dehalococcoidia bacterium]